LRGPRQPTRSQVWPALILGRRIHLSATFPVPFRDFADLRSAVAPTDRTLGGNAVRVRQRADLVERAVALSAAVAALTRIVRTPMDATAVAGCRWRWWRWQWRWGGRRWRWRRWRWRIVARRPPCGDAVRVRQRACHLERAAIVSAAVAACTCRVRAPCKAADFAGWKHSENMIELLENHLEHTILLFSHAIVLFIYLLLKHHHHAIVLFIHLLLERRNLGT